MKNKLLLLIAAVGLMSCGGGGGDSSNIGGSTTSVYTSSSSCHDGARLTSNVNQASADELVPLRCAPFTLEQQALLNFIVKTSGIDASATNKIYLEKIPANAILLKSSIKIANDLGEIFLLTIENNISEIVSDKVIPFSMNFRIVDGVLNFLNAPSLKLIGKNITSPTRPITPTAIINTSAAPYIVSEPIIFYGNNSITTDSIIKSYIWDFGDGAGSVAPRTSHAYSMPGSYIVSLKIYDTLGRYNSSIINLKVSTGSVMKKLNDTGVTGSSCYSLGSNGVVDCNSQAATLLNNNQDGMIGRDLSFPTGADGRVGFSFSAVGNNSISDCIKDNVTGLIWEAKTTNGLRNFDNLYTNYDDIDKTQVTMDLSVSNSLIRKPTIDEVNSASNVVGYVNSINSQSLCGYSDWRVPTVGELISIIDYGNLSTPLLFNTSYTYFWTSSPWDTSGVSAMHVNFYLGRAAATSRSYLKSLKLVR